jgi:hypothetical protein
MISQNISKIIPKTIGERHNKILEKAFKDNKLKLSEKIIFPVDNNGYISIYYAKLRILNCLDYGV